MKCGVVSCKGPPVTYCLSVQALPLQLEQGVGLPRMHDRQQQLVLVPLVGFLTLLAGMQSLSWQQHVTGSINNIK